jgi:hypothetical protein
VEECRGYRQPSSTCILSDMNHLSKYLTLSNVVKFLVKLFSCCYSFAGSSSVLVADALVERP